MDTPAIRRYPRGRAFKVGGAASGDIHGDGGTVNQAMPNVTRNTRQRAEVLTLLREVEGFYTAQQLHQMLIAREARVGLTTVYRTLQLLVDAGEIDSTRLPGGERWADQVAAQHGFTDVGHTLEIFGTCATCAR
jgi:Fur family ferric uptake transcriptional regulator